MLTERRRRRMFTGHAREDLNGRNPARLAAVADLDEPPKGLDLPAAWEMESLLMELAASGRRAVLISTHDVETIPRLCNRAIFLAEGKITRSWERDDLATLRVTRGAIEECLISTLKAQLEA
ncbi:hypothetical protein A9Z06_27790 [Rhizobium sp. YK2]|nr:hypothetical protein A9Z06_27790 [Rhizobium sp. YK2]